MVLCKFTLPHCELLLFAEKERPNIYIYKNVCVCMRVSCVSHTFSIVRSEMCGVGMCSWTCLRLQTTDNKVKYEKPVWFLQHDSLSRKNWALEWFRPFRVSIIYFGYIFTVGVHMCGNWELFSLVCWLLFYLSFTFELSKSILEFFHISSVLPFIISSFRLAIYRRCNSLLRYKRIFLVTFWKKMRQQQHNTQKIPTAHYEYFLICSKCRVITI